MGKVVVSLCALLLLASCATMRAVSSAQPPVPAATLSPSVSGTATVTVSPIPSLASPIGLTVNSTPPGAQVYLNDIYIGDTPLTYTAFQSGTYKMRISKIGYFSNDRWVTLDPTLATTVDAQLQPKTGFILVSGVPGDASVFIDGAPARVGVNQVQTGVHQVTVSLFGYKDWSANVPVQVGQSTEVTPSLVRAPFRITGLAASRRVLGPSNPGPLGSVILTFNVTAPGSGAVSIRDPQGEILYRRSLPPFDGPAQRVAWRGRTDSGRTAPNGVYTVVIAGHGAKSDEVSSAQVTVRVESTALISFRSIWSGASGLLYAPTPEVLPTGSFQVSSLVAGSSGSYDSSFPVQLGMRFTPLEPLEIDAQTTVFAQGAPPLPFSVGAAAKFAYLRPRETEGFSAAVTLGGTFLSNVTGDLATNYTGISLGLPAEYRIGAFGVVLDPQLIVAPYAPYYGGSPPAVGWTGWGYGRAGLFLDLGSLVVGASAALRSAPFSQGFALAADPASGGVEVHWLLPGSQVVLSGALGGETTAGRGFSLIAGAGIGILN